MEIKIKNKSNQPIPSYAKVGDSGMDIRSTQAGRIMPGRYAMVTTGLYFEIPCDYELQVRSRSGLANNKGVFVLNGPGTIDSSYRGELKVILANFSKFAYDYKVGDRIAQIVLCPIESIEWNLTDELSETDRGSGGIGHTGVSDDDLADYNTTNKQ